MRKKSQENWKSRRLRLLWLWAGAVVGGNGFCRIRQGFRLWRQVDWTGEEREKERERERENLFVSLEDRSLGFGCAGGKRERCKGVGRGGEGTRNKKRK